MWSSIKDDPIIARMVIGPLHIIHDINQPSIHNKLNKIFLNVHINIFMYAYKLKFAISFKKL